MFGLKIRPSHMLTVAVGMTLGLSGGVEAGNVVLTCEKTAGKTLATCMKKVSRAQGKCFVRGGSACDPADAGIAKALAKLARKVSKKCPEDAVVQGVGYGPSLTVQSLIDRLQAACTAESLSLASRSFGGPQGAALAAAGAAQPCLEAAHREGGKLLAHSTRRQSACVMKAREGGSCSVTKTAAKLARSAQKATARIGAACAPAGSLAGLIALDVDEFLDRTAGQARCMAALAHPDPFPLELDCGPRPAIAALPRGQYTQIVLDEAEWGTRCGDGSSFAFWIRPAPEGEPVENVLLQMQGGGVCILEDDCAGRPADLFEALSDNPVTSGIMSNDPLVSPFASWTKVYLPYCNQDVFIGGGATSNFDSITVHRYGAINTRAALRYLRDAIWRELDASTNEGYRPDRIRMLFGGTSAGGFGALYNYHYVLDDLQWAHTSAWPDAALALDNGQALGLASLGLLLISDVAPLGWDAGPFLPPYCFASDCGVGPVLYAASAPRLGAVPEQQFLVLSNQVDLTQVGTTFFADLPTWINAMRQSYCDTKGTNGLHYFLPAITASTHVMSTRENLYTGQSVDGIVMRDWLERAITNPGDLTDAVEEGTLVADYPGTVPFPCSID